MAGQWAQMGCKTLHFLKPGADGPPDRLGLAELLTCATQPGLVSPGGGDQAQWYPPVLQEALRLALAEFHGIYCVCVIYLQFYKCERRRFQMAPGKDDRLMASSKSLLVPPCHAHTRLELARSLLTRLPPVWA